MHDTYCSLLNCLFDLGFIFALGVLDIFVTFHSVCFTSSSLAISEDCCMESVNDLTYHTTHPNLIEKVLLSDASIAYFIKLKCLRVFVFEIILEIYNVTLDVDVHLARCIVDWSFIRHCFTLEEWPNAHYNSNFVEKFLICFFIRLLVFSITFDALCSTNTSACLAWCIVRRNLHGCSYLDIISFEGCRLGFVIVVLY